MPLRNVAGSLLKSYVVKYFFLYVEKGFFSMCVFDPCIRFLCIRLFIPPANVYAMLPG